MFYYFEFEIIEFSPLFYLISIQGLYVIYWPRYNKENRLDDEIRRLLTHTGFSRLTELKLSFRSFQELYAVQEIQAEKNLFQLIVGSVVQASNVRKCVYFVN